MNNNLFSTVVSRLNNDRNGMFITPVVIFADDEVEALKIIKTKVDENVYKIGPISKVKENPDEKFISLGTYEMVPVVDEEVKDEPSPMPQGGMNPMGALLGMFGSMMAGGMTMAEPTHSEEEVVDIDPTDENEVKDE